MVPCATAFNMEKQFQSVYTISKFKEVQNEFTGKVYCDLILEQNEGLWKKNEVREHLREKHFLSHFKRICVNASVVALV